MQLATATDHPDGNVVRLDVAVRNALLLQIVDHSQQVGPEPLQQVDVKPTLATDSQPQRLDRLLVLVGEHGPHQKRRKRTDLQRLDEVDEARMPHLRLAENIRLIFESAVVLRAVRDFHHEVLAAPFHQKCDRA